MDRHVFNIPVVREAIRYEIFDHFEEAHSNIEQGHLPEAIRSIKDLRLWILASAEITRDDVAETIAERLLIPLQRMEQDRTRSLDERLLPTSADAAAGPQTSSQRDSD